MRVLVAILDWGLGHATRSIPVIAELQRHGCTVLVAGSGDSLSLLREEFPNLSFFELPGYAPRYPTRSSMVWTMAKQVPRFARTILAEHRVIEEIVTGQRIDRIISDNRYGCWSACIPSAFITHQSNVLMPKRFGFLRPFVRMMTTRFINRFTECWIPDFPAEDSLAGKLGVVDGLQLNIRIRHVGSLSRFAYRRTTVTPEIDILTILSGPEPQRTILENIVMPQLKTSGLSFRMVRGLVGPPYASEDPRIVNFLTTRELQLWIESARIIVARSGYSTVMDMKALGKKVIFIPTPQQTEQEYLAQRLMSAGVACYMSQEKFDLKTAVEKTATFTGFDPASKNTLLAGVVSDFLHASVDMTKESSVSYE